MDELTPEQRHRLLSTLAERLRRWHLHSVAGVIFGMGRGAGVVASQLLLTLQPLAPLATWRTALHEYALALEDDASWQELLDYLDPRG